LSAPVSPSPSSNASSFGDATGPGPADDAVELWLPATSRHLRLARLTAAGLAADLGFTVDEIEDLRLAVDEACAVLVETASDDARLDLVFRVDGDTILIDGRCASDAGPPALHAVVEAILHTTLDEYQVSTDGEVNEFHLVKRSSARG
jgi:serine/threonine-protein kinase RsbW